MSVAEFPKSDINTPSKFSDADTVEIPNIIKINNENIIILFFNIVSPEINKIINVILLILLIIN